MQEKGLIISEKSIVQEARDTQLAVELITPGARLQMLESETQLSRGCLIELYKELCGSPPSRGMLPLSTDWFITWEQNVHVLMLCNTWQFLLKTGLYNDVDAVTKAYRLYFEQCPQVKEGPLLTLTHAWTLVWFVESGLLQLLNCNCCGGNFIAYAYQSVGSFACSLCQPPSRAVKRRKLSQNPADIIPQLLDEQRVQTIQPVRRGETFQQR